MRVPVGFRRALVAVVLPCMLLLLAPRARAAALDLVEPRLERSTYQQLIERLHLDDDGRMIAGFLYSDYAVALEELASRIEARADEMGRQRVEDALHGRVLLDRDELASLRVAVLSVRAEGWAEADHLLDDLLMSAVSLVHDETVDVDAALRDVRRDVLLAPRRAAADDDAYAGDGIDLTDLVAEARKPGGELADVDPNAVAGAVASYVHALDAYLASTAAADRKGRLDLDIANIKRDREAIRAAQQGMLDRWKARHVLTVAAVEQIAAIARQAGGDELAERWRGRFARACFPRLYRPTKSAQALEWMQRHVSDAKTIARATAIVDEHRRRHEALCREAGELMLQGRMQFGVIVHPRMGTSYQRDDNAIRLFQELLRNSGRRASLDFDTYAALESLLDERQRKQMAADLVRVGIGG